MRRVGVRLSCLLVSLLGAGLASAHEGHDSHGTTGSSSDPLPLVLFFSGLLVLGAGLYLGIRSDVDRIYAVVGIGLGLAGLAAALVTLAQ